MLSRKSCSWEKSRAIAHPYGRHFFNFNMKMIIKIRNEHDPENYKLCMYAIKTICRPSQSCETILLAHQWQVIENLKDTNLYKNSRYLIINMRWKPVWVSSVSLNLNESEGLGAALTQRRS
jgi:hypothetical protein